MPLGVVVEATKGNATPPEQRGEVVVSVGSFADRPIPKLSRARVRRPRISERLDQGVGAPLTLIVAPAGSGKTTALAQWVNERTAPVTWVTATSDTAASLARVEAALQDVANAQDRAVIIVDDAHRLPSQAWPLIEGWLDSWAPGGANLVLASRRDVPLPVVLLELSGNVTEIRSDVLGFTDSEARELIALHAPHASEVDAAALQERADGWAAALVLGGRAIAGAGGQTHVRETLSQTERPVLDYLLGEVFSTLPAMVRHVLLCTGGLDRVTDDAAVVLSGDPEAGRRLAELAADGMLVTQYESAGAIPDAAAGSEGARAWRYHPLLLELLRRQTALDGPDHALAGAAHARAARHYSVHGPIPEAVRHAMWARDYELLTGLLIAETPALIGAGHVDLLHAALRTLPASVAEGHPALLGVTALAHLGSGDFETAARLAAWLLPTVTEAREHGDVHPAGGDPGNLTPTMLADSALLGTWQARIGWLDPQVAIRNAREVLGCALPSGPGEGQLEGHPSHRPLTPLSLPRLVWLLNELTSAELWVADLESAAAHNEEALDGASVLGYPRFLAEAWSNRALLDMVVGRPLPAIAAAQQSLAFAGSAATNSAVVRSHIVLGWAALIDFRFSDVIRHLEVVGKLGLPSGSPLSHILVGTLRASLAAEAGDLAAGREYLTEVTPGADRASNPFRRYVLRVRAEWAVRSQDEPGLRRDIELMRALGWTEGVELYSPLLTALGGDVPAAIAELTAFLGHHPDGVLAAIGAASRLGLLLQYDDESAVQRAYREALDRIAPQRLFRTMAYAGLSNPRLSALVKQDASSSDPHPFTAELAQALTRYRAFRRMVLDGALTDVLGVVHASEPADTTVDEPATPRLPTSATAEPRPQLSQHFPALTARERDVLNELALGGAYADIARNLYVTENTVKTHILSVYRKLGVDRRADALRRARELGLLG
jgi:DNA-binding CsgD family transcriptional regulator